MTQEQVFKQLLLEMEMRFSINGLSPNSQNNHLEIAKSKSLIYAIKNTWHWYNNQEDFKENCLFYIDKC
jgi:hypothetical protein